MQSKLLFFLLVSAPVFAQEIATALPQTDVQKSETLAAESSVTPAEQQPTIQFNVTRVRVEFRLIQVVDAIDKTIWQCLKQSARECTQLIKDKQYEKAGALLDTINNGKPEGVKALFIVRAATNDSFVHARLDYMTDVVCPQVRHCSCVLCEIAKSSAQQENWKNVIDLVFGVMRSQRMLSYDEAKQLAFLIISKSA